MIGNNSLLRSSGIFVLLFFSIGQAACSDNTDVKWDPHEMLVVPDDGLTYYLDEEVLNIEDIAGDVIVEGTLEIRSHLKVLLHPNCTFLNPGLIIVKEGCSLLIDGSKIVEEREKPAFYSTGRVLAHGGRFNLGGTIKSNTIFSI